MQPLVGGHHGVGFGLGGARRLVPYGFGISVPDYS